MKTLIAVLLALVLVIALIASFILNFVQWRQAHKMQATISSQTIELDRTRTSINMLEEELRSIAPDVLKARRIPIELKTRNAFTGAGLVLIFINKSNNPLSLGVRCTSASLTTSKQFKLDVVPDQLAKIGSQQGWTAGVGDKIEVSCAGYDDSTFTIR
jgi:hypothetical protein